jgi:N4-gp56 family major capsid protein
MPDATTFSTDTTNFDKTVQLIINRTLEELLRAPLPHLTPGNFIQATHVAGSNGTMRFLNIPDLVVDDQELADSIVVTQGEPNDSVALTIGYEEFSTRQRMKSLKFTDVALLQSPQKLMAIGAERLARYVLALADKVAANAILAGTNVIYSGTGNDATDDLAAGDVLLSSDIKRGVALLEGSNLERFPGDTYRGILHPYVKFDVELDDDAGGWIDANRYAGAQALFSGELGQYAGVRFMSSSNAGVKAGDAGDGADVYSTTIFGPRFFAVGDFGNNETFVTPPGGHDDPGHQSAFITWKGWMDAVLVGEMDDSTGSGVDSAGDDNTVSEPRYLRIESTSSI